MATKIFEFKNKDMTKLSYFCISDEWYSLNPWKHEEKPVKFFDYVLEFKKEVLMEYYIVGPFALIRGRLYDD